MIPDGFNFEKRVIKLSEIQFRKQFGFKKDEILVGMMARVRTNKAIQIAVQFVAKLQKQIGDRKTFNLIITQSKDFDYAYFRRIEAFARKDNVNIKYIGQDVFPDIDYLDQPHKYPSYSTYQAMDFIIYPPIHEGFGNQAIEAAWAKKILVMHEYPVADADILTCVKQQVLN